MERLDLPILHDIVAGARQEVTNKPRYRDAYYAGGLIFVEFKTK